MDDPKPELVVVLAPTGKDGRLIARVLGRVGIAAAVIGDMAELCLRCDAATGSVVVAEEALAPAVISRLEDALVRQAPWSDLPLVILTGGGKATRYSTRVVRRLATKGNVTLLERPLRMMTLISAVQSALRARRRQHEVRGLLDQAREAVRHRDTFLAMLGHELRNPLSAIRAAAEVVSGSGDGALTAEQAGIITRQSGHMAKLVDDLLDVARVTSGKITLQRRVMDLREVARGSLQGVASPLGAKRHLITFDAPGEPVAVDGDAVRLEQVATNLLTNAIRYTPDGGKIRVAVHPEGGDAVLRVADNGSGIPAEMLGRIFDPFVQTDQPLARTQGGLGVGLTLVRGLVRMHGGDVTAASGGPGSGCEFTVRIPLAVGGHVAVPEVRSDGHAGVRHVLVVEDNPDTRRAMERLLAAWGHRVGVAGDGASGVARAVADHPDVALVDVGLPDIDGYEVARQVRAATGGDIYLIALTGYGQPEDRRRAEEAGFDRHLVKPVSPKQLRLLLADAAVPRASDEHR